MLRIRNPRSPLALTLQCVCGHTCDSVSREALERPPAHTALLQQQALALKEMARVYMSCLGHFGKAYQGVRRRLLRVVTQTAGRVLVIWFLSQLYSSVVLWCVPSFCGGFSQTWAHTAALCLPGYVYQAQHDRGSLSRTGKPMPHQSYLSCPLCCQDQAGRHGSPGALAHCAVPCTLSPSTASSAARARAAANRSGMARTVVNLATSASSTFARRACCSATVFCSNCNACRGLRSQCAARWGRSFIKGRQ